MRGAVETLLVAFEQNESREHEIAKQQAQHFLKTLEQMHAGSRQDSLTVTDVELSDNEIILDVVNSAESMESTHEVTNGEVCTTLESPTVFEAKPLDTKTAEKQVLDLIREVAISAKIVELELAPNIIAVDPGPHEVDPGE